jgi:hypothetical protein
MPSRWWFLYIKACLRSVQGHSKLADVGNPLVRHLGRYLRWPRVYPVAWRESQGRQGPAGQSRLSPAMAKSTKRIAFGADQPRAFRLPWRRFSVIFLSGKANARVYDTKSGQGPHSPPPQARWLHLSAWKKSRFCDSQSGLRAQTANQAKFIPPTISPVPRRRYSLARSVKALSLTSKS